ILESLASAHPEVAADLAADVISSHGPMRMALEDSALDALQNIASRHPGIVMDAVGRRLCDPDRQPYFGLLRFEGLFEAIGLVEVGRWVTEHGGPVPLIARHLDSPRMQDGEPFVPPVTAWVMGQFGSDNTVFHEFCAGRHDFEVKVGHARDR